MPFKLLPTDFVFYETHLYPPACLQSNNTQHVCILGSNGPQLSKHDKIEQSAVTGTSSGISNLHKQIASKRMNFEQPLLPLSEDGSVLYFIATPFQKVQETCSIKIFLHFNTTLQTPHVSSSSLPLLRCLITKSIKKAIKHHAGNMYNPLNKSWIKYANRNNGMLMSVPFACTIDSAELEQEFVSISGMLPGFKTLLYKVHRYPFHKGNFFQLLFFP